MSAPLVIYAESTPNPNAMMFVANRNFVDPELVLEFENRKTAAHSPLATDLFNFPFITGVFITRNVITLTKSDAEVSWNSLVLEMREHIKDFINKGGEVFTGSVEDISKPADSNEEADASPAAHKVPETEAERQIVDILEEYIRPAVENDGGAIHFAGFSEGVVTVKLRGACSGCPSSSITLKAGIEALLKRMVPDVKEVVAESA